MGMHSPIEQFEVHDLSAPLFEIAGHPVAFTNYALAAVLALLSAILFLSLPMRRASLVPGRWQLIVESFFGFIETTLIDAAGPKAKPFVPFIFSIFLFILLCNLLGLVPGVYTVTSQVVANLALALLVIFVVLITGFVKHGVHFLHLFTPSGVPGALLPLISGIEVVSFFVRAFSLSLRLFGNMLAGHILLKVFAGMSAALTTAGWAASVSVFPLIMNVAIVAFEIFVAFLQAYIFTLLSSVYLRDGLEMH